MADDLATLDAQPKVSHPEMPVGQARARCGVLGIVDLPGAARAAPATPPWQYRPSS